VTLNAEGVSRHHARLFPEDGAWQVEDLGSTNGTRVNNSMVQKRELESGDTVVFGRVCYKYTVLDAGSSTTSGHTIDLGAADQTMIMNPVAAQEVNAALQSGDTERTTRLRAAGSAKTVRGAASRPRPVAPDSGGSGGTWVVVAVLAAAIVAGGAYMLGIF
jgi:predicted component of type VI protein secretion system